MKIDKAGLSTTGNRMISASNGFPQINTTNVSNVRSLIFAGHSFSSLPRYQDSHKFISPSKYKYPLQNIRPVRIRVRIDPPHSLVCRKKRLNGAVLRMRPGKPKPCVTVGVAR
jgi:hypothetical protein